MRHTEETGDLKHGVKPRSSLREGESVLRALGSRSCSEDKPVQHKASRPYMDKHLGVISSLFQDLKHV